VHGKNTNGALTLSNADTIKPLDSDAELGDKLSNGGGIQVELYSEPASVAQDRYKEEQSRHVS
jgi:hypothetical protein